MNFKVKILLANERPVDFSHELQRVKKVLVITPSGEELSDVFQNFLKKIVEVFSGSRVSTFDKMCLRKEDLSWLGLPNERYLKIFKDETFDLVVDLNTKQDNACSYLAALSGAPMRLNLDSGKNDFIYNLHIKSSTEKKIEERLNSIISYFKFLVIKK